MSLNRGELTEEGISGFFLRSSHVMREGVTHTHTHTHMNRMERNTTMYA
jgi:hypothetical protein